MTNDSVKKNILSWNRFGHDFSSRSQIETDTIHYGLCIPGEDELKMLPSVQGKTVLDVGCGSGENCLALSKMGARVVGLEPSHSLFGLAEDIFPKAPNGILLNEPWGWAATGAWAPYDLVLFVGSSDFIALDEAFFQMLSRITQAGSYVLLARMHPFWTSLFLHETDEMSTRCYFDDPRIEEVIYGEPPSVFVRFHYGIGSLLQRFSKNGWRLERLEEPKPVPEEHAPFVMPGCYEDPIFSKRLQDNIFRILNQELE